jgi:hypothetical protein
VTAITVRLPDEDHELLQLHGLVTGKSQNAIMTELLRAELDPVLPAKREAIHAYGKPGCPLGRIRCRLSAAQRRGAPLGGMRDRKASVMLPLVAQLPPHSPAFIRAQCGPDQLAPSGIHSPLLMR